MLVAVAVDVTVNVSVQVLPGYPQGVSVAVGGTGVWVGAGEVGEPGDDAVCSHKRVSNVRRLAHEIRYTAARVMQFRRFLCRLQA